MPCEERSPAELGEDTDRRGQDISERGRGKMYRFKNEASWAVGRIGGWAKKVPHGLFFCSFLFLFCFSYLFHNFCKIDSKQFKPMQKIL
jgi:hypothetical protein